MSTLKQKLEKKINELEAQRAVEIKKLKKEVKEQEKKQTSYFVKQQEIFDFMYNRLKKEEQTKVNKLMQQLNSTLN